MGYKKNILFKKSMFLIMGVVSLHDKTLSSSSDMSSLGLGERVLSSESDFGQAADSSVNWQETDSSVNGQEVESKVNGQEVESKVDGQEVESKVNGQEVESKVDVRRSKENHQYWNLYPTKKKITPVLSKSKQKAYFKILEKLSSLPRYDVNSEEYNNFKNYTHELVSKLKREEKILELVHPIYNTLDFDLVFKKIKSYQLPEEYINKIDSFTKKGKKEFAKILDSIVFL